MKRKAYKYRIYPNTEQKQYFAKCFGCVRFFYNKSLSDMNDIYKEKILSILKNRDSAITISDAQSYLNVTQQRATAILKSMELNGMVYKNRTITGMIFFTLAE